ncbi:hypothetical protein C8R45DRAFT_1115256 [Mycena sanguinolenta]|nr:hypothetical protein C8R45DRAFT_1115256 [Mycena sanguinolenta]
MKLAALGLLPHTIPSLLPLRPRPRSSTSSPTDHLQQRTPTPCAHDAEARGADKPRYDCAKTRRNAVEDEFWSVGCARGGWAEGDRMVIRGSQETDAASGQRGNKYGGGSKVGDVGEKGKAEKLKGMGRRAPPSHSPSPRESARHQKRRVDPDIQPSKVLINYDTSKPSNESLPVAASSLSNFFAPGVDSNNAQPLARTLLPRYTSDIRQCREGRNFGAAKGVKEIHQRQQGDGVCVDGVLRKTDRWSETDAAAAGIPPRSSKSSALPVSSATAAPPWRLKVIVIQCGARSIIGAIAGALRDVKSSSQC